MVFEPGLKIFQMGFWRNSFVISERSGRFNQVNLEVCLNMSAFNIIVLTFREWDFSNGDSSH